ncbi:MAG: GTPase [Deltaproteobacteria bacterium]|nr:GTPase [Deltaproteobacteria bacterium]
MNKRVVIMGAGGRDFHNFNRCFRDNEAYRVIGFTAAQIPGLEGKVYPPELAGQLYPDGIPIYPENAISDLVKSHQVDLVVFAYSDVSHLTVGHKMSLVLAAGADFIILGPDKTMIPSRLPVLSICATRTGCGKSELTRKFCRLLTSYGVRAIVVRHPMAYGDLARQAVQRFETREDLDRHHCTIEEREEYEPLISQNTIVYAGVDYAAILAAVEQENPDMIIWDGGNNDFPFYKSDLEVVVVDPLRLGTEVSYHPGETNLRRAQVVVINKVDSAAAPDLEQLKQVISEANPTAVVVMAASPYQVPRQDLIRGKKVLVIEDGPTLTHGGMAYGVGVIAAKSLGAAELVDPRAYAVGSMAEVFRAYPQMGHLLPAMGYSQTMIAEMEATIAAVEADVVLSATPIDLTELMTINKPVARLTYEIADLGTPGFKDILERFFAQTGIKTAAPV